MFTGIIEVRGDVVANHHEAVSNHLRIHTSLQGLEIGESIAVNGVCLTLVSDDAEQLAFDVSPETLKLTTLGSLIPGDVVNIERAMLATARFGGHYVSGHVDTTVVLQSLVNMGQYIEMTLGGFLEPAKQYLLPKGSITLDGVSLTINSVADEQIKVMLVPHTLAVTTLGQRRAGQRLNVEFDYLTRVVAHQLNAIHRPDLKGLTG